MSDTQTTEIGQTQASWRDSLPDDLKASPHLSAVPDVPTLAKNWVNAQALIGRKGVIPPTDKDPPEMWDKFYSELGRPESPDKYDLGDFKAPEYWNPDEQKAMLAELHKAGVPNKSAKHIVESYAKMETAKVAEMSKRMAEATEAAKTKLRAEWGTSYDAKLDVANRAFKSAFGQDLDSARTMKLADGSLLFDNPALIKAFASLGANMSEDSLRTTGTSQFSMTPEQAKAEIAKMEGDKELAAKMADKNHPEHRLLNDKRLALYRAAYSS